MTAPAYTAQVTGEVTGQVGRQLESQPESRVESLPQSRTRAVPNQLPNPARYPWHEVKKVEHYRLDVNALKKPMTLREEPDQHYGHT